MISQINLKKKKNNKKMSASSWFVKSPVKSSPKVKLFAFGYSGAQPATFQTWQSLLQPDVQVVAVSLPGRGSKPADSSVKCVDDLAAPIAKAVMDEVGENTPFFVFYGHSFGGLLSWLVTTLLRENGFRLPSMLIVGGKDAPFCLSSVNAIGIRDFSFAQMRTYFMEKLLSSSTPKELLANEDFMKTLLAPMQIDRGLSELFDWETSVSAARRAKLDIPIYSCWGEDDDVVPMENVEKWEEMTNKSFEFRHFPGGHCFMHANESESELLDWIVDLIKPLLK